MHCPRRKLRTVGFLSGFDKKRSRGLPDFLRKRFLIDIYARTRHHIMNALRLCAHLRQNPAYLFIIHDNIVWPLNPAALFRSNLADRFIHGNRHHQRKCGRFIRRTIRTQHQCHIDIFSCRRYPAMSSTSAPRRLHVRYHKCTRRFALLRKRLCVNIGRACLFMKDYAFADLNCVHITFNCGFRKNNTRIIFYQSITLVILCLYHIAVLFQLLYRLPNCRARNTIIFAKLLSADIIIRVS